jgi:hypothetical protein
MLQVLDVPCVKVQIGKTMRRRHDASSIVDLVNKINAPEGLYLGVAVICLVFSFPLPLHSKFSVVNA